MQQTDELILGVDTHDGAHVGVLIDALGRRRGAVEIPTDAAGHDRLLAWSRAQGRLRVAGVEGTGSYAASLVRFLAAHGVRVVEVNRPNRQRRRRRGTSDPADAEAAARAVLAGEATAVPEARERGRRGAHPGRQPAQGPHRDGARALGRALRPLTTEERVTRCARLRPRAGAQPGAATKRALRHLARRWQVLDRELRALDADLAELTDRAAPRLLAEPGVGPGCAARLLVAAGDNPTRLRSDAALAALCGATPVEASSGTVLRHRLNRGGDRQANTPRRAPTPRAGPARGAAARGSCAA